MNAADLEAVTERTVELVNSWWNAKEYADNCPASERDDARGVADEAWDEIRQYLSHIWGGAL